MIVDSIVASMGAVEGTMRNPTLGNIGTGAKETNAPTRFVLVEGIVDVNCVDLDVGDIFLPTNACT